MAWIEQPISSIVLCGMGIIKGNIISMLKIVI